MDQSKAFWAQTNMKLQSTLSSLQHREAFLERELKTQKSLAEKAESELYQYKFKFHKMSKECERLSQQLSELREEDS